ncbi:hypothetical protein 1 [Wenzhou tombus-like virus 6]|uniref:hypothetical protein 1 n=1 Tax=Wenzhou tombus-like virus 6 TaxID=1923676 RepID=UPI00090A63A9|nr:hypothetical protein 1 [Wenzhou tombus-like virus 6]APG76601.1 hypothetical protein 1 [Wenzhou tombus-like virus 6]
MFDLLIGASTKAIKDFLNYAFNKVRHIYYSFKRWLWELAGAFTQHDAFVDLCYGHMADIEEFEYPLAEEYLTVEEQHKLAMSYLEMLQKNYELEDEHINRAAERTLERSLWPSKPVDEWPCATNAEGVFTTGPQSSPYIQKPQSSRLAMAVQKATDTMVDLHHKSLDVQCEYTKHKGLGYFSWWNTLPSRMRYVHRMAIKRSANEEAAKKLQSQVNRFENLPELLALTVVKQEPTGKVKISKKLVKKTEKIPSLDTEIEEEVQVEVEDEVEEPIMRDVRSLIDSPEARRDAARWMRAYLKMKNHTLGADALSQATIGKYIADIGEKLELDMASRQYLLHQSLVATAIPTHSEITREMIIQSPAARELRHRVAVLNAEGF